MNEREGLPPLNLAKERKGLQADRMVTLMSAKGNSHSHGSVQATGKNPECPSDDLELAFTLAVEDTHLSGLTILPCPLLCLHMEVLHQLCLGCQRQLHQSEPRHRLSVKWLNEKSGME